MKFRVAVIGSGAIGSYYGGKLAAAGGDVHFLGRGDLQELRERGLRLLGPGEDIHVAHPNFYNSTHEIGPCDLVTIAVKATSNAALPDLLPPLLREDTILLTLQNGLGNEEFLAGHFGAERIMGGLCFICLSRTSRTTVERYDYGHVTFGEFGRAPSPRTHAVATAFQEAGVQCHVVQNLARERWRKLVWNIPFNGLSILAGGIDTAAILADDLLKRTTFALMAEVIDAANHCGSPLEKTDALEQIKRTECMGAYKPSTMLDFETGRPLEVEAIWGEPLRRAASAGASTPRLEILYSILRSLNQVRRTRGISS